MDLHEFIKDLPRKEAGRILRVNAVSVIRCGRELTLDEMHAALEELRSEPEKTVMVFPY